MNENSYKKYKLYTLVVILEQKWQFVNTKKEHFLNESERFWNKMETGGGTDY